MRYIDTGSRREADTLGAWLQQEMTEEVNAIRLQSGYFNAGVLPYFDTILRHLAMVDGEVKALIGSNDGETVLGHIQGLIELIGLPRMNASLGILRFEDGLFHPKCYHIVRCDNSQAAYVGSANLTSSGAGLHIEAGLIMDTRHGDDAEVLAEIASRIDWWFEPEAREGLHLINGQVGLLDLVQRGVIAEVEPHPRRNEAYGGAKNQDVRHPRLTQISRPPRITPPHVEHEAVPIRPMAQHLPSIIRHPPYPDYVRFAPGLVDPTIGQEALSGAPFPQGQAGLIIKLSKDSARRWRGVRRGTTNISLPIMSSAVMSTLRFGVLPEGSGRPRCEFQLEMRYLYDQGALIAPSWQTNVMIYGFEDGDKTHPNVRLPLPAQQSDALGRLIQQAGRQMPENEQVAFLEWPTMDLPTFRLSVLEVGSELAQEAENIFNNTPLAGRNQRWLPQGLSPAW